MKNLLSALLLLSILFTVGCDDDDAIATEDATATEDTTGTI